jgi:hypothetical protein
MKPLEEFGRTRSAGSPGLERTRDGPVTVAGPSFVRKATVIGAIPRLASIEPHWLRFPKCFCQFLWAAPMSAPTPPPRRRFKRLLLAGVCIVFFYPASYFMLGSHATGYSMKWDGTGGNYYWHDRGYPFDPWIYQPMAWIEQRLRGRESQVVIDYNGVRGGQPIYIFGPHLSP